MLVVVAWSSAVRFTVRLSEHGSAVWAVLAIPLMWAAIDALLIYLSPHGSAGSIAYSQMNFLPLIQIASLGGVPAITFVVLLAGSCLGLLLARLLDAPVRGLTAAGALTTLFVCATLMFGVWRLAGTPHTAGVRVTMIATDSVRHQPGDWSAFWKSYGSAIDRAATSGTIVVLPETVVRLHVADAEEVGKMLGAFTRVRHATIVVGVLVSSPNVRQTAR